MNEVSILDLSLTEYKSHAEKVMTIAYNKGTQVLIFAEELRRLCQKYKRNFPGLFAQAWHETGGFTSDLWKNKKNPAGLKNANGNDYQSYVNGVDAARAFFVHMSAYLQLRNQNDLINYRYLDARYLVAIEKNKHTESSTMDDLSGRWAEDKQYGRKILQVYKDLYGVD